MVQTGLDAAVPGWFIRRQLGITKQTLRYWVTSGKLTPVGSDSYGRPHYRYRDALLAERDTRNSPNSRRGATLRPRSAVGASA